MIHKEFLTYVIALILIVFMGVFETSYKIAFAFLAVYLIYFCVSICVNVRKDQRKESIVENQDYIIHLILADVSSGEKVSTMQDVSEEKIQLLEEDGLKHVHQHVCSLNGCTQNNNMFLQDDQPAKLSLEEFCRFYFFGHHHVIIDLLLIPVNLVFMLSIPNLVILLKEDIMPWTILVIKKIISPTFAVFFVCLNLFYLNENITLITTAITLTICLFDIFSKSSFFLQFCVTIQILSSVTWIKICSQIVMEMVFAVSNPNLDKVILSTILVSTGNNIPDFFNNGSLSQIGQQTVAIYSVFSGQLFNLFIGYSANIYFSK